MIVERDSCFSREKKVFKGLPTAIVMAGLAIKCAIGYMEYEDSRKNHYFVDIISGGRKILSISFSARVTRLNDFTDLSVD
jgi:hypothetical protein